MKGLKRGWSQFSYTKVRKINRTQNTSNFQELKNHIKTICILDKLSIKYLEGVEMFRVVNWWLEWAGDWLTKGHKTFWGLRSNHRYIPCQTRNGLCIDPKIILCKVIFCVSYEGPVWIIWIQNIKKRCHIFYKLWYQVIVTWPNDTKKMSKYGLNLVCLNISSL